MTLTAEPAAPSAAPPPPRGRRLGRRGRIVVATGVAAVVLGAGIGVGAGYGITSAALDQVRVVVDAQPFACRDPADATTTRLNVGSTDVRVTVPAVRLHPGLRCTMTVAVVDDGDADVRIERVVLPFMGGHAGAGVHAGRLRQQGVRPSGDGTPDAVFDFAHNPSGDYGVGSHQAVRLTADLTWSNGCMSPGASEWHWDAPLVTVAANGVSRQLKGGGVGYAVLGTRTSCDR